MVGAAEIQAIAAVLTLVAIVYLARSSIKTQEKLANDSLRAQKAITESVTKLQREQIEREEAYRVEPILRFTSGGVTSGAAILIAENVGRGPAYNLNLNVTLSNWLDRDEIGGRSNRIFQDRISIGGINAALLETKIEAGEIIKNEGDMIFWGSYQDEKGRITKVERKRMSCEYVSSPNPDVPAIF